MGKSTIEWLLRYLRDGREVQGYTFNPWFGCTHDGPDCLNCYAEGMMDHRYGKVQWDKGQPRRRTTADYWKQPLRNWNREAAAGDYRIPVFCASLADWADQEGEQAWRDDLFELIAKTHWLDWLMLTKRTRHILQSLPSDWVTEVNGYRQPLWDRIPAHIWWMFSAGNQKVFDQRWPYIAPFAAAGRIVGISAEPLLGPLRLPDEFLQYGKQVWVIAGGESGQDREKIRPTNPAWVRSLRNQCLAAGAR